ncbi:MAG: hypothetical protein ACPHWZ_01815, partial [Longimicrobiales bacterium]
MTRAWWLRIAVGVLAGVSFTLAWTIERSSLERGNRLQRSGEYTAAAELYAERTRADAVNAELRYNLGTALAQGDDPTAEDELARATLAADPEVRGLAHYNTGVLRLDRALYADVADSVRIHAAASVAANRLALRMRPDDDDAKWNLAMALRLLDSV